MELVALSLLQELVVSFLLVVVLLELGARRINRSRSKVRANHRITFTSRLRLLLGERRTPRAKRHARYCRSICLWRIHPVIMNVRLTGNNSCRRRTPRSKRHPGSSSGIDRDTL